jgi:hypothetical protein
VRPEPGRTSLLVDLAYELLDAHSDAMALGSHVSDPAWVAHADYVRALQRRGREILALSAEETARSERVIPSRTEDIFD